ncbi:transcriptional regulator [Streptomyces carminius]|uniref:Transcriptional regulator n=1 Tax=Streptomyces carminius TaxID=2665496 RepID=A0A2M8LQS7_9ACTN|nr:helix-turn-helix transcriptional regulator [Streptomyces carminius]PJE94286.1 transcriptional regulator [Streptomyces carminius]
MAGDADTYIGSRLREVRKRRGLTQRRLAAASGVSLSLIRKLEQGELRATRLETARRLAVALHVPTSRLIVRDADRADAATADRWDPVRRALTSPAPSAEPDEEPTARGVCDTLQAAMPLFTDDRFAELAEVLPPLLHDAEALAEADGSARAARSRLLQLTGWLLTQNRQYAAASQALERSLEICDDRLQAATTVSTRCWLLLRQGQLDQARALAARWADDLEPRLSRATPSELSTWGWLLLRLSAAAVRDNRPDKAEDALRLARAAAAALGHEHTPAGDFLRTFGPMTVAFKRAENASVTDRPDQVLKLAAAIPVNGMRTTSNNRNRHLLDVANAHTAMRQYAEAVDVLTGLHAASPQWLPNQRYARDILSRVVNRRRTLTPQTRELADAIGVPL